MSDAEIPKPAAPPPEPAVRAIEFLRDVTVKVTIELGSAQLSISELMDMKPGYILDVEKPAGDPVDVRINGRPIARGEVIAFEDSSGISITEILKPQLTELWP